MFFDDNYYRKEKLPMKATTSCHKKGYCFELQSFYLAILQNLILLKNPTYDYGCDSQLLDLVAIYELVGIQELSNL